MQPFLIGISGGSGSGKTSLIERLSQNFRDKISVLSQDNYYHPQEMQARDERGEINYDLPSAIDVGRFVADIDLLKSGMDIQLKEYVFNNPAARAKTIEVKAVPIVVVEGLFVFHESEIRKRLDLTVFIDADEEIQLNRRIKRDGEERGYSEEVVRYQWENHVKPAFERYLLPHRNEVDVVVTNNVDFEKGIEILESHLRTLI